MCEIEQESLVNCTNFSR